MPEQVEQYGKRLAGTFAGAGTFSPRRSGARAVAVDPRARLHEVSDICRLLNAMAGTLARELLPRGRREGHLWCEAKTGNGGLGDSLKLDTKTGKWRWYADDQQRYGDVLDLYCLVTGETKG